MFFKKVFVDGSSAWKLQNREQEENPIYKYINLQKQGRMIDVYKKCGLEGLEQLVRDELPSFMYHCGRGGRITKFDHSMWSEMISLKMQSFTSEDKTCALERGAAKERNSKAVQKESNFDFAEHEACWDLKKRGSVGESIVHLAMLFSDLHVFREITRVLLSVFPKLALDIYEGEEYYGESGLHIAIVYKDLELTKLFVANGANVNQRATGRFFLPEDQKNGILSDRTNYNGFAYYGEYPLAFAACFGQEEIYDYLIEKGADPNLQDSFGNTVLHMMSMLSLAVKHQSKKANIEMTNHQNLTPLTLASKLGRMEIFNEIIKLQSQEIWRYSNITCSVYPLAQLDTIGENGKTNSNAALIYITNGDSDSHLTMLDDGIIKQLLADKWKNYVKRRFLERLLLAIVFLITLSVAIYTRSDEVFYELSHPLSSTAVVRYVAESFVVLYCLVTIVFLIFELRTEGILSFVRQQSGAPAKCFFNVSCLLILTCVPLRFCDCCTAEKIIISIAAPCAWAHLLFFSRMFYFSGVFVVVFYQMLRGDLVRFGVIYVIFFIGFGQSFYFLFKTTYGDNESPFNSLGGTVMKLFEMTLGDYQEVYESFSKTAMPVVTKFVFISFAILVPILLLNMLIATFVHTYEQIIGRSEKEWKRQWAKIIIVLERTFAPSQLVRFQENYSVKFGCDSSKSRGLMVIKTSTRSISRQRKEARANWKRIFAVVKNVIRSEDWNAELIKELKKPKKLSINSKDASYRRRHFGVDMSQPGSEEFGILAAAKQLAWEKDIDLDKANGSSFNGSIVKNSEKTDEEFKNLFQGNLRPKTSRSEMDCLYYSEEKAQIIGKSESKLNHPKSSLNSRHKMTSVSGSSMTCSSASSLCSSNSSATHLVSQPSRNPLKRF